GGAPAPGTTHGPATPPPAGTAPRVSLSRTTYDQVTSGTTVSLADAQPGDLVFFYDDISHVGVYIGNGMMIHAPKPGAYVREESIYYGGESIIHSVVRPA
ncbi:C40 family peptidase, partial [Streptomyces sp. NPDC127079]|uniref:C40 family peptidase n=1 Tax=Streptomyces sp. NPDC127079 TaxID=3347132 RepID=UPI003659280A